MRKLRAEVRRRSPVARGRPWLPTAPLPRPRNPLQVGFGSFDSVFNGLFVAQDKGFFKKQRPRREAHHAGVRPAGDAGPRVAGAVDVIGGAGGSGLNAIANGADIAFIGSIVNKLTGSMVTRADTTDPATQLKGGKWAISLVRGRVGAGGPEGAGPLRAGGRARRHPGADRQPSTPLRRAGVGSCRWHNPPAARAQQGQGRPAVQDVGQPAGHRSRVSERGPISIQRKTIQQQSRYGPSIP